MGTLVTPPLNAAREWNFRKQCCNIAHVMSKTRAEITDTHFIENGWFSIPSYLSSCLFLRFLGQSDIF